MIRWSWRLFITFFLVMVASIWPTYGLFAKINPPWIMLFVLYIQIYTPKIFRVFFVFILGLYLDALFVSVFGEHVIAMLLPCWLVSKVSKRFVFLSTLYQLLLILTGCLLYQLSLYFIEALLGHHQPLWYGICSAILGMLFWPWFRLCIERGIFKTHTA